MNGWTIAWYELMRTLRYKRNIVIQLVLPLLIIFILGTALSKTFDTESTPFGEVQVAVWNADGAGNPLAEGIKSFLQSKGVSAFLTIQPSGSEDEVVSAVTADKADFGLIVPSGFSERVLSGGKASWEMVPGRSLLKNFTARSVLNSYLEETNRRQAAALVLGPQALASISQPQGDSASPLLMEGTLGPVDKKYNAFQYYGAAMLIMFILYSGMAAAVGIVMEREQMTLTRLQSMPLKMSQFVAGKIGAHTMIAFAQSVIIIVFSHFAYGIDWGTNIPMLGLICLLAIVCSMLLAVAVSAFARTMKVTISIFQFAIIVMTALSGGFGPFTNDTMDQLAKYTSSYWASRGIMRLMTDDSAASVTQHVGALAAIAGVLAIAAVIGYRKVSRYE